MKKILLSVVLCMAAYFTAQAQSQLEQGKRLYQEAWNYCYNIIPQQWQTDHASKLYRQALPYLQAAAKEGYGEACYLLGNMYSKELGVKKDYAIAKRMYELSIEYGHDRGTAARDPSGGKIFRCPAAPCAGSVDRQTS